MKERKIKHLEIVRNEAVEPIPSVWVNYHLPYKTLLEVDYAKIDTGTTWLNKTLKQPLLISSMTGGRGAL